VLGTRACSCKGRVKGGGGWWSRERFFCGDWGVYYPCRVRVFNNSSNNATEDYFSRTKTNAFSRKSLESCYLYYANKV